MASQSISNRYIKLGDLRDLLATKFGAGKFKILVGGSLTRPLCTSVKADCFFIQEEDESYEITVPVLLNEVRSFSIPTEALKAKDTDAE